MTKKDKRVAIVGAGINGLVAANYLARAGFEVTILERKDHPGGACTVSTLEQDGESYSYPPGASVFGMMEQFVFQETGLAKEITAYRPSHPELVYASGQLHPLSLSNDPQLLAQTVAEGWGEHGDVLKFLEDLERVTEFLRKGFREAKVPTAQSAAKALGVRLFKRWIAGSARSLLDYYLTSDPFKVYYAVSVIESGPVKLDAPYSAFTIPLMASGGVFGGEWGYVKGGLWQVPLALHRINTSLGVQTLFSATVADVDAEHLTLRYEQNGKTETMEADYLLFANDPLSAARSMGDQNLIDQLLGEELVGTSGKLVLFFKEPVKWKDDTGMEGFDAAFRHVIMAKDLDDLEALSDRVAKGETDVAPSYLEIYCEGAGDRALGGERPYDLVSVFFKNMSLSKKGKDLPEIKKILTDLILAKIENPEALIDSILETPKDISELFFFPGGNIDAVDLSEEQTFFRRTYSTRPEESFYQFGSNQQIFYCAAGAYPCGSVAGTPGYMCAKQIIVNTKEI